MKKPLLYAAALACALALATPALAEGDKPDRPDKPEAPAKEAAPLHPQQARMKACNAEAGKKNLKGDERKAFMSACLKG